MIYSVAAFAWVGGITAAAAETIPTSDVVNGACYTVVFWKSQATRKRKKTNLNFGVSASMPVTAAANDLQHSILYAYMANFVWIGL